MKKKDSQLFNALSFAWELGFFIVVPIGGFLFLGFLADRYFEMKPLFLVMGLITGVSVAGYGAYHFLAPFLQDDMEDDDK